MFILLLLMETMKKEIKITEQTLPPKIYHESDIPYSQSDSIAE